MACRQCMEDFMSHESMKWVDFMFTEALFRLLPHYTNRSGCRLAGSHGFRFAAPTGCSVVKRANGCANTSVVMRPMRERFKWPTCNAIYKWKTLLFLEKTISGEICLCEIFVVLKPLLKQWKHWICGWNWSILWVDSLHFEASSESRCEC